MVRSAQRDIREQARTGELRVASMLETGEPASLWRAAQSMPLWRLLLCERGVGPERMRRVTGRLMIRDSRPVGSLTARERTLLAQALRSVAPGADGCGWRRR